MNTLHPVFNDTLLRTGFANLHEALEAAGEVAMKSDDLEAAISALNRLTELCASVTTFATASRGTKIESWAAGAVLTNDGVMHIDDKVLVDGHGARLVPKIQYLNWVLRLHTDAISRVAQLIAGTLRRHTGDRWRELAKGLRRFEAPAFFRIRRDGDSYVGDSLTSADVAKIALEFFGAERNFMRHVVVTRWVAEQRDEDLLRLITGHANSGLEMPAPCSLYSPLAAIAAAGNELEDLLARWLPRFTPCKESAPIPFVKISAGRIAKGLGAHRHCLLSGLSGPMLVDWHLAAERIVSSIRRKITGVDGQLSPGANLLLHLAVFDGIHDSRDLRQIYSDLHGNLLATPSGWVIQVMRENYPAPLRINAQAPTAALLLHFSSAPASRDVAFEASTQELDSWLKAEWPSYFGDSKSSATDCLLACAALWCDLMIPTGLQYCYEAENCAALLDERSSAKLHAMPATPEAGNEQEGQQGTTSRASGDLEPYFNLINRVGDNTRQLGELKARASALEVELKRLPTPKRGTWIHALALVCGRNIELVRAGKASAIEFSSMRTYFSNLRRNIVGLSETHPGECDAMDWHHVAQHLREVLRSTGESAGKVMPGRSEDQLSAANWFLRSLKDCGFDVPDSVLLGQPSRFQTPHRPTAVAFISAEELATSKNLVRTWNQDHPIQLLRIELLPRLLKALSLRWSEAIYLRDTDILSGGSYVCIQSAGFSHLKSYSARRICPLQEDLRGPLDDLIVRLRHLNGQDRGSHFLFLDVDPSTDEPHVSHQIHGEISDSLRISSCSSNSRVHWLRTSGISDKLFPEWAEIYRRWQVGTLGPTVLAEYFGFTGDRAWHAERVRNESGHAQTRTTLAHYAAPSIQFRALALASTLAAMPPGPAVLANIGVSSDALRKESSRKMDIRTDPWLFVRRRSNPAADDPTGDRAPVAESSRTLPLRVDSLHGVLTISPAQLQYLALRLMDEPLERCQDRLRLATSECRVLEKYLEADRFVGDVLRQRVAAGDPNGRARAADIAHVLSAVGFRLANFLLCRDFGFSVNLLDLLSATPRSTPWSDRARELADEMKDSDFLIEIVPATRHDDLHSRVRLFKHAQLRIRPAQRDIGSLPRFFLTTTDTSESNRVRKARVTVLARLMCQAHLLALKGRGQHDQAQEAGEA